MNFGNSLGTFTGPLVVGWLADAFGFPVAIASLSVFSLLALGLMALLIIGDSKNSSLRLAADDLEGGKGSVDEGAPPPASGPAPDSVADAGPAVVERTSS